MCVGGIGRQSGERLGHRLRGQAHAENLGLPLGTQGDLRRGGGNHHGIATHDPAMIQATKDFAREKNIGRDKFEFQMLYGIRTDLQEQLVRESYRLRVYIPYGTDWFPYFMRRLAERPANLAFFLRNLLPRSARPSSA